MTISRIVLCLLAMVLAASLGACASVGTAANSVALPTDYRQSVADHIASEYVKDGVGPATISQPSRSRSPLKDAVKEAEWVVVRYPVRDRGSAGGTITRCIRVASERTTETYEATGLVASHSTFRVTRPKTDGDGCSGSDIVEPYGELESAAAKLKAQR